MVKAVWVGFVILTYFASLLSMYQIATGVPFVVLAFLPSWVKGEYILGFQAFTVVVSVISLAISK